MTRKAPKTAWKPGHAAPATAWKPGQSGNPNGRPKIVKEIQELAREHTADALNALVAVVKNPKSPPAARVSAAEALLDRGYGRAPQSLTLDVRNDITRFLASLGMGTAAPHANGLADQPSQVRH